MECSEALDDRPLRQGDIFEWLGHSHEQPWNSYGVVVTADCDIEQKKTHGRLSYIPALTMEHYVWSFWRPLKFQTILDDRATKVAARITKILKKRSTAHLGISKEAAIHWISRSGPENVIKELAIADKGQASDLTKLLQQVDDLDKLLKETRPDVDALKRCYCYKSNKEGEDSDRELIKELQGTISSLPGDVFFLSGIPTAQVHGLFLMLRHISQCDISDVGTNTDAIKWGDAKAKRIARIDAPYRYAITQNLARVFSDIGLPNEYDQKRKASPSDFVLSQNR